MSVPSLVRILRSARPFAQQLRDGFGLNPLSGAEPGAFFNTIAAFACELSPEPQAHQPMPAPVELSADARRYVAQQSDRDTRIMTDRVLAAYYVGLTLGRMDARGGR